MYTGKLHFFVDGGRADIQSTAEDERETQYIVHLIREVGTTGADNHIRARSLGFRRPDFRLRVGQCEYNRFVVHGFQHLGAEYIGAGKTEENIFAGNRITQYALAVISNGVAYFTFVHTLAVFAGLVNHAFGIANGNVFALHAQSHQQIQAGNRSSTGAGTHQLNFCNVLFGYAQGIQYSRGGDDGCTVLVIVEYWDITAFAQFFLNVKTFGRFDVFQVDAAESRLQRSDGINQFIRIGFVDFDIEYIDTGKFFE